MHCFDGAQLRYGDGVIKIIITLSELDGGPEFVLFSFVFMWTIGARHEPNQVPQMVEAV